VSTEQKRLYGLLALVLIIAAGSMTAIVLLNTQGLGTEEPSVTIVGSSIVNVTLSDMLTMSSVTRNGSYQNTFGNVRGEGTYTGVRVSDLVELAGGMTEDDNMTVIASDGYNQTFAYSKVYPNQTIYDIQGDMVIAYRFDGQTVPDYPDGYRLMFLPEDGYYSNADANASTDPDPRGAGPQCVSNVARIVIVRPPAAALSSESSQVAHITWKWPQNKVFVGLTWRDEM